jgi:acetyl-CoA C-acetyltransferase
MRKVVVVSAKRTAIANFGSAFKDTSAVQLGVQVVKAIIEETKIKPEIIDEVIIGNVLGAGLGQNVARQVSVNSNIPTYVPSYTINKVCGSGMKAISLAALMIANNEADIVIAGGIENMSQSPYLLPDERWGARMGDKTVVDSMIKDGLSDIFNNYHMGITAENLADEFNISKEDQDQFATNSQLKAEKAISENRFKDEIVPVIIPQRKGDPIIIDRDEFPKKGTTFEGLSKVKAAFKKDGTVSAANSSGINDGAALLLLMSEEKANDLGLNILAYFVNSASAGVDPSIMGYGPVPAIKKVLNKSSWSLSDIDLAELNEAFASQSIAVLKGLKNEVGDIDPSIVNVNGGAIALGHPIGASGARIVVSLIHEMIKQNKKKGLAALCIGGGMGIASLYERK